MRTVPTASKKLGLSGLLIDARRLPFFAVVLIWFGLKDAVDPGWRLEAADDGTALDEKLRKLLSGGGSLGLVLLRLRWWRLVLLYRRGIAGKSAPSFWL